MLQLACVKFLVEARNAQVNQQTAKFGWTPLHHCARMAHYRHAPYLQIFQYLLEQGADPRLCTWLPDPQAKTRTGQQSLPLDMAVNKVSRSELSLAIWPYTPSPTPPNTARTNFRTHIQAMKLCAAQAGQGLAARRGARRAAAACRPTCTSSQKTSLYLPWARHGYAAGNAVCMWVKRCSSSLDCMRCPPAASIREPSHTLSAG